MSNNKDFKVKAGIQPTSYFEGVGTVVSGGVGYNLAGASYDSVSLSVFSQDSEPPGLAFNSSGTKMYVLGNSTNSVYQYSLSTAFDLSTASYDSVSFSVASQEGTPVGLAFNTDGTKMYVIGMANDAVFQYSLSTGFDLSTASYDSVSFSVASQETVPTGFVFDPSGTKMYVAGGGTDSLYQYSLSTAFDLSTASYDSVSFNVTSQDTIPRDVAFNSDGTKMYVVGLSNGSIFQYSLSTAFDLSTASYDNVSFSVSAQDNSPVNIAFNPDGTRMFLLGTGNDSLYQYSTVLTTAELDLSTGSVFEVTPTSDIQVTLSNPADSGTVSGATLLLDGPTPSSYDLANAVYDSVSFSVASQETVPRSVKFNTDGTKMYIVGTTSDNVHQYSLSTGFDLSTASYDSVSFSVASQDGLPLGLAFNDDGTKMYVVGFSNNNIYQYTLSTAFDLSTASYDSVSFSTSSEDTTPNDIRFNNSGTKMYIAGGNNDRVYQYSLSTAFDLSTASYDSVSFSVASQEVSPTDLAFNSDGTKMFVVGFDTDSVYQYGLSTAFDLSTASYDSVSFSVASEDIRPEGFTFSNDGTKMYVVGITNDAVYQYTVGSEATITYDTAIEWPSGTAPTSPAIGETDIITFNTRDGGTTYQGVLAIDGAK